MKPIEIVLKWKSYRDRFRALYVTDEEIEAYNECVKFYTGIIRLVMGQEGIGVSEAVNHLCKQEGKEDIKMWFLYTGYEMVLAEVLNEAKKI